MEQTDKPEKSRTPTHPYIRSDRVEGTAVYAADGSRIGTIKYLEIEKVSGQIIYAITSFNAFLAVRADTHTIPWSKLKYDPQLHDYRTDITQEQLHNAPEFSRGDEFDWHKPEKSRTPTHPYVRSDRVEGTAVYAADGSRIGTIKYLEIEKVSGQIIYAITSFNAFLAVRADTHTIPWSKLKYDPQLHGYRTDITQEQLHNAPEFSRGDEFDWPEQERERLHRYWHSPPYGGM